MRAYRRDSHGRFAGGGGGKVTFGRAGGFASASFRAAKSGARRASAMTRALGNKTVHTEHYLLPGRSGRGLTVAVMRRSVTAGEMAARVSISRKPVREQRKLRAGTVVKTITIPMPKKMRGRKP